MKYENIYISFSHHVLNVTVLLPFYIHALNENVEIIEFIKTYGMKNIITDRNIKYISVF